MKVHRGYYGVRNDVIARKIMMSEMTSQRRSDIMVTCLLLHECLRWHLKPGCLREKKAVMSLLTQY